ncbi:MAG: DNA methyltransferase, partial [Flammeovirgaceae bacterium]
MKVNLQQGDCLDLIKNLPDESVDCVLTDPPYELGFMGKKWDNTGIAYNVDLWKECLRVLKPGGHLLAFSGTRTYHRMAVAIEDAGFEVRDMLEWIYASGFPKSLNIGKKYDQLQGNEREEKEVVFPDGSKPRKTAGHFAVGENIPRNTKYTKGNSEWEGYGTALKPAHEPI